MYEFLILAPSPLRPPGSMKYRSTVTLLPSPQFTSLAGKEGGMKKKFATTYYSR